jgi:exodeoxyribonuclease III
MLDSGGMRILAVNVRSGGSRSTIERLVARCLNHRPDCISLSEFRNNSVGAQIRQAFEAAGFIHQAGSAQEYRGNGVLIVARQKFEALRNPFGLADDEYPNAVVEALFGNLRIYGVYLPGQDRKRPHLRCLIAAAQRWNERKLAAVAIGDFNSGRNETDIELNLGGRRLADEFSTAGVYRELEQHWTEAWLHVHPDETEFSWYPFRADGTVQCRNGWRLDKAFVSDALLPKLRNAEYDHGFRLKGLTDHSALIVDFVSL